MKFKFENLVIWQKAMDFGEQINIMGYSIRSLAEVVTCLYKAKRRNYINEEEFNIEYEYAFNLMNMMIAFTSKIK